MKAFSTVYRKATSRLRNKLIFTYICIIILPLAVSTSVTYIKFSSEIDRTYIQNNALLMHQLNQQMDDYFQEIDQFVLSAYNYEVLANVESEPEREQKNAERLNLISLLLAQKKEIVSILYYRPVTGEAYYVDKTNVKMLYRTEELAQADWYQKLMTAQGGMILEPLHTSAYPASFSVPEHAGVFTIDRTLRRTLVSRVYGVLSVNVSLDQIRKAVKETMASTREDVVLLNNRGDLFYDSNEAAADPNVPPSAALFQRIQREPDSSGHLVYKDDRSKRWMVIYNRSNFWGNVVYKIIPVSVLNHQASSVKNFNIATLMGIAVTLVLASILITYKITKPLFSLEKSMKRAGEGDFNSFARVETTDEIGHMALIYNKMLNKINNLVTDKYVMELNYRLAQLKTLQAQINPHFLYNTLQSIGSVALEEGLTELYAMTQALSGFLRYSIKAGGDMVELAEELKHTERYLLIQKFRYEEKLHYEIEADDDVLGVRVPKLVLQPIVENAVVHGLEPKKGPGSIQIRCRRMDDEILLIVSDDGLGMNEPLLTRMRESVLAPFDPQEVEHLGLKNVYQRLKLALGERCGIRIESSPDAGTTITFKIPC